MRQVNGFAAAAAQKTVVNTTACERPGNESDSSIFQARARLTELPTASCARLVQWRRFMGCHGKQKCGVLNFGVFFRGWLGKDGDDGGEARR